MAQEYVGHEARKIFSHVKYSESWSVKKLEFLVSHSLGDLVQILRYHKTNAVTDTESFKKPPRK